MNIAFVVVPRWFLVWYNFVAVLARVNFVVVPRWFLVWYNISRVRRHDRSTVVVPRWFLVWYNYKGATS